MSFSKIPIIDAFQKFYLLTELRIFISWVSVERNLPLIESNSKATLLMSVLSPGDSTEHASPIWKTNIKHSVCSHVQSLQHITIFLFSPTLLKTDWSKISIARPGNANLTKLWRFKSSLNSSSVGCLPVNISNKKIPKLYISPLVESWLPISYSAKSQSTLIH